MFMAGRHLVRPFRCRAACPHLQMGAADAVLALDAVGSRSRHPVVKSHFLPSLAAVPTRPLEQQVSMLAGFAARVEGYSKFVTLPSR